MRDKTRLTNVMQIFLETIGKHFIFSDTWQQRGENAWHKFASVLKALKGNENE